MFAVLEQFETATKQQLANYSYFNQGNKEEDMFDAEALLAGIPDEDLDEESKAAKRKAIEKKRQQFEEYNKKQTLADVLNKSSENILDHILEKNMAEAEIYIEMENEQLAKQSRMLQRAIDYGKFDDGSSSDEIGNKMKKLQMINQQSQQGKPINEKIEFWEELHQPKE